MEKIKIVPNKKKEENGDLKSAVDIAIERTESVKEKVERQKDNEQAEAQVQEQRESHKIEDEKRIEQVRSSLTNNFAETQVDSAQSFNYQGQESSPTPTISQHEYLGENIPTAEKSKISDQEKQIEDKREHAREYAVAYEQYLNSSNGVASEGKEPEGQGSFVDSRLGDAHLKEFEKFKKINLRPQELIDSKEISIEHEKRRLGEEENIVWLAKNKERTMLAWTALSSGVRLATRIPGLLFGSKSPRSNARFEKSLDDSTAFEQSLSALFGGGEETIRSFGSKRKKMKFFEDDASFETRETTALKNNRKEAKYSRKADEKAQNGQFRSPKKSGGVANWFKKTLGF